MSQEQPTQPSSPQYPLTALALFPLYSSRADFQAKTGKVPPAFDVTQPVKNWADLGATATPYSGPGQVSGTYIMYPANSAQLQPIFLPLSVAGSVNMLPDAWTGGAALQGTPLPLRALLPNEKLTLGNLENPGTIVERTDLQQPETNDQQFADLKAALAAIRTVMSAIQTKLGA